MAPEIADIRLWWEIVREGLEVIRRKCDAEWRVEDVYAKCVAGEWTLFLEPGSEGLGFLLLSQYRDVYRGEKRLSVECAFYRGESDPFEAYEPFLFDLAAKIGARCVEFRSPRLGFRKKGWAVADVVYRKEVP